MNSKFSISIKDIRAIKDAEIVLNGLTVLAGENGCGKSTISKLLYGFVKTSLNFNVAVSEFYSKEILNSVSLLNDFIPSKYRYKLNLNSKSDIEELNLLRLNDSFFRGFDIPDAEKYLSEVIVSRILAVRHKYEKKEYVMEEKDFSRILKLYEHNIRKFEASSPEELLNDYENHINELIKKISELKITHNIKVFNYKIAKYFYEKIEKWNYLVREYESDLVDRNSGSVTFQNSFSDVFFIDVPTLFDVELNSVGYIDDVQKGAILSDLKNALSKPKNSKSNAEISTAIENILEGRKISKKRNLFSSIFVYTAKNGDSIPLSQAASGLKCFAVLERLFANGCLGENTLLIVDEPEVHLHPKWIVEYARVLVLIQKYLHTTILIASHNPDMVSAIKYISEKEKCSDSLSFYIAEEVDTKGFGKYKFKNLGTDIEPIFSSFNIAIDRINQYGVFGGE